MNIFYFLSQIILGMKMSAAVVVQTDTKQNMHESGLVRGRAKVSYQKKYL